MLRQRRSREEWRRLVAELEQGGLTRQEFAAERGVNWRSLENWFYRFRREHRVRSDVGRPPAVHFVPVKVPRSRSATAALVTPAGMTVDVIEAQIGAMHLRFRTGVDSDYMVRLLAALSRDVAC